MSSFKLKQTYPPPAAASGANVPRASAKPATTASSQSTDGRETNAALDEDTSAKLTGLLQRAGFVPSRVRMHSIFASTLDSMWANFGFIFAGNFTEGWGYNLYAMNGRPGFDSRVSYKHVLQGSVVHCDDCNCPDKGSLTCSIAEQTGVMHMTLDVLPILKKLGMVFNSDGEVLAKRVHLEKRIKKVMSGCSTNPEVIFTEQLPCCQHFTRRVTQSLRLPSSWCRLLEGQPITLRPRLFLVPPQDRDRQLGPDQTRPARPEADPDFSGLERILFHKLSAEQGQLYMVLKYLLLEALPELLPNKARPFTEVHCRQLLWYLLSDLEHQRQPLHLIGQAGRGLKLLAKMLTRKHSNRSTAMRNYFDQRLTVPFAVDSGYTEELVDRNTLHDTLSSSKLLATVKMYMAMLAKASASGSGNGTYFVFRPLLMVIPGSCPSAVSSLQPMASIADYPRIGFKLYRALDILLDESQPSSALVSEFDRIVDSLGICAATAAGCLRSLMVLKTGRGSGLAQQALMGNRGQITVTDCFQLQDLTERMVESALLETDCAWIYRCRLHKEEKIDGHGQRGAEAACHSPCGTQFLASYPRIRSFFLPARQKPKPHMDHCCFEYLLRINFIALWNSLRSQLAQDWGSCVTTADQKSLSDSSSSQSMVEAQELVAQALICSSAPTRRRLFAAYEKLLASAAPFHLDSNYSEWRWMHLIRLHLMGTWLSELVAAEKMSNEQKHSCCELVDWCVQNEQFFHCSLSSFGVRVFIHSGGGAAVEAQARSVLRSLLDMEMQQTFPLTPESGFESDLLVMQLYASHWSERKAKVEYQQRVKVLAKH